MHIDSGPGLQLPFLTADLPGVGGVVKRYNEDFEVEELPLYVPSGDGTHVYFGVEKRATTTWDAIRAIARALGRPAREIGYAGMKDAHAVTRQTLSLEHVDPQKVAELDLPHLRILWVNRHTNKLKLGHLRGNRFVVRVRETAGGILGRAREILTCVERRGVPNYFGPQRFGVRGDNAEVGLAVVRGDYARAVALVCGRPQDFEKPNIRRAREFFDAGDYRAAADNWPPASAEQRTLCREMARSSGNAERAWRTLPRDLAQLYQSALQSALFNRVLAGRIQEIDRLYVGDVAWKHVNGAAFLVADAEVEQPRCAAFEISPTGPLFGYRLKPADGLPGQREAVVLADCGLTQEDLARDHRSRLQGARRPLRFHPGEVQADEGTDERGRFLRLVFTADPGCYATSLLREVCKND